MKLNLLPSSVSKGGQLKVAVVSMVVMILVGAGIAVVLTVVSQQQLTAAKNDEAEIRPKAEAAFARANQADDVIAQAKGIIVNSKLAQAMSDHNSDYPKFYDGVMPYIPPFYRITSMSATPTDETNVTLNLTGILSGSQRYADLMIALMRIKGASSVGRAGFTSNDAEVPALGGGDQTGRERKPGQGLVPDDLEQRLAYLRSTGSTQTYTGLGNFGAADLGQRNAGPDASVVSVTVVMKGKLQTPDPRATLTSGGSAAAAPAAASFGGGGFVPPGAGGFGGPPGAGAGASADDSTTVPKGKKGKGAGSED